MAGRNMEITVAKTAGFCFGVKRAVEKVYDQIATGKKPIYTYGPIIHNEEVVRDVEEKGVKERREQQIAERYEGRADERVTSTEANEVVKDVGKTDRKPAQQKQAVDGKDKKLSIHERLEINKRIIQEKQGKDKPERGADLGVRTV